MIYFELLILSISFILLIIYLCLEFFRRPGRERLSFSPGFNLPKVCVLKPISNIDDEMEKNIETFFNLDYPDYEIVFGIDSAERKCIELVERLRSKYPHIPSKLIPTVSEKKLNPKIGNLAQIEDHCVCDIYWLTDSNVRVNSSTLRSLVHEYIEHDSKIVFSPILGTGSRTFGSIMENAYLNYFVSANIIAGWMLVKQQIIVGKSMLIESKTLKGFGGFSHFKEYLAEDFIMGRIYTEHKLRVSTNYIWVTNYISTASIGKFWHRVVRWSKIRYNTERLFYFVEILLNPIIISAFFALFLGKTGLYIFAAALLAKIFLEYMNLFMLNREDAKKVYVLLLYPLAVVLKDILLFMIYLAPFFSKKVYWRGRKITLNNMGKIIDTEF